MELGSPRLGFRPLPAAATEPFALQEPAGTYTSPRLGGAGGVLQDGPEVARRAAEWERQIESLDQKEMEIHQTQLRLIREQTTTFRGDLLALQQELVDLKAQVARQMSGVQDLHSKVDGRLSGSEGCLKELVDSVTRHGQLHQESERKLSQLGGSIENHHRALSHHANMKERMDYVEKVLGDSADKHQRALEEAHAKLDVVHGRLQGVEGAHSDMRKTHSDRDMKHVALQDRVAYLEKLLGDSADQHARDLDAQKKELERGIRDHHARASALEQAHASVNQRLVYLEQTVGDSADRHAKEIDAMRQNLGKVSGSLQHHASVADRLAYIEGAIGDSADRHQAELNAAHQKIDKMGGHAEVLDSLRKGHANVSKDLAQLGAEHATWAERVTYIEKMLGDSADKHAREIETLKAAHNKLASDSKFHSQNHAGVTDKVDAIAQSHGSIQDRMNYIERAIGDSFDKHAKEVVALKSSHASHSQAQKEQASRHANVEDRLEYIEKAIGDSADKHAALLASQQAKIDSVHGKLGEALKDSMRHASELNSQKDYLEQHHSSMEERLVFIEKTIGDSADRHRRELEQLKSAHMKIAGEGKDVRAKHGSLEDRLAYIENWFRGFKAP